MAISRAAPLVRLRGVSKRYGLVAAVDGVDLDIARGEFFALLGRSGSGKTTLLRLLAGFEPPDQGSIEIDGQDVAQVPPYARPVNMMFQAYALFPHMTVRQNIAYGLHQEGKSRAAIAARVADMLALVQMSDLGQRKPHQLSGGQKQRVALARALAREPKLLLLDEPLAALDKKLRERTEFELMRIQRQVGVTFVVVTHDQEEAMTMATRIGVMERGRLAQIGTPNDIYEHPRSRFVADFIGSANILDGTVMAAAEGILQVQCPGLATTVPMATDGAVPIGAQIWLAIRPEKIELHATAQPGAVAGEIVEIGYHGDNSIYHVRAGGGAVLRVSAANAARDGGNLHGRGQKLWLRWAMANAVLLHH